MIGWKETQHTQGYSMTEDMAAAVLLPLLLLVCSANLERTASFDDTVKLECPPVNRGVYGQDTWIRCSVRGGSGRYVSRLVWKRLDSGTHGSTVSFFGVKDWNGGRFESGWDKVNMEVWLLVRNTQDADEGRYKCLAMTDQGYVESSTSLKVTARYTEPTVWSVPERNIVDDMEVTMFCQTHGGYPRGTIHWFDQYGTNWTRSAKMEAQETKDKRFDLTSEFTVWRVSSGSPGYRCRVVSSDGGREGEAELHLMFRDPEKSVQRWSNNSIVAVIVVVGSLATGVLLLVLLQRRGPPRKVHTEEEDIRNEEEGAEKEEEESTAC
ncbi:hypothetical protein AAFF_G00340070 [Aldrovandia affinis]|uniref:Ig-like domain-containing protein n=1 Tax=Aldrovandia affinis TaxID=143900 RepID=A0AAD7WQ35_9TELE|nr:hypothetical protein AAFF_G00340070 [Aldrovandia affinis]